MYIFIMLAVLSLVLLFPAPAQGRAVNKPQTSEAIERQADLARSRQHMTEAIALYRKALRQRPTWVDGWWWLGSLLYEQDRFQEAKTAFAEFIKTSPDPGVGFAFLALCEYETHDDEQSLNHFETWTKRGTPGPRELVEVANFHRALLITREGEFNKALFLLEDILSTKLEEFPALTEAMGIASLRMANLPEDYAPEKRELVWLAGKAAVRFSQEDFWGSDEYMRRLLLRYGGEPNVHYLCGNLLGLRRKYAEAAGEYRQELQRFPGHVSAMIELALVQIQNGNLSEAHALANQAAELEPKNSRAVYALGKSFLATDQFAESARELEIAKRLSPESASVRYALASAYKGLGRKTEAKREADAFLSLQYARVHRKEQAESPASPRVEDPK